MVVSATFGVLKTQLASERAVFKCMPLTCIYVVAVKYVWKREKKERTIPRCSLKGFE